MPEVSICIPAFNAERFLQETLESIASQGFTDWEIVVTEDGSHDRTEQIVSEFAKKVRQPVIYNRHERNLGLPAARNTGAAAASGVWIAFIDSDDLWMPSHLADLVSASRREEVDMVFAGTQPFDHASGTPLPPCIPSKEALERLPVALFSGHLSILPSATMVRRSCFQRYGGFSTLYPHANDSEYWLRILRSGGRAIYTGNVTCLYRKHPGAMSLRATRILTNTAQICASHADWDEIPRNLARERPARLYRYAARSSLKSDPRLSLTLLFHALRIHPFLLRSWGLLMYSLFVYTLHGRSRQTSAAADGSATKMNEAKMPAEISRK